VFLTWPSNQEQDGLAVVILTSDADAGADRPAWMPRLRLPSYALRYAATPLDKALYGTDACAHKGYVEYNRYAALHVRCFVQASRCRIRV
jgi:hypothetical protein